MNIDFIYFDVGGVLVLDFSKTNKWNEMMTDLGANQDDLLEIDARFVVEEPKYCLGEESVELFIDILRQDFRLTIPANYSMVEDFATRFEPNPTLASILKELKTKYKIGILTNTYTNLHDRLVAKGLLPKIDWEVIIDSSKVGFQKPQTEIYTLASELAHTPPPKILFIENTKTHVEKAKELGWNTILYDPSAIEASNVAIKKFLNP